MKMEKRSNCIEQYCIEKVYQAGTEYRSTYYRALPGSIRLVLLYTYSILYTRVCAMHCKDMIFEDLQPAKAIAV